MDVFSLRMFYVFRQRSFLVSDPSKKSPSVCGIFSNIIKCNINPLQRTVYIVGSWSELKIPSWSGRDKKEKNGFPFLTETCSCILPEYNIVLNEWNIITNNI